MMVVGDARFVSPDGAEESYKRGGSYTLEDLLAYHAGTFLCQPAVFFTREALRKAGELDEELPYTMDLDLWLRMRRAASVSYVDMPLAQLRRHDDAKTWAANYEAMLAVARTLRRYDGVLPPVRRLRNRMGMRRCRAVACLKCALRTAISGGSRWRTMRLLGLALSIHPGAGLNAMALRVAARVMLPAAIRKAISSRLAHG